MIFDLAALAVLIISCIIAFLRGFIRETLTIAGVVGGSLAAVYGGPFLAPLVRGWMNAEGQGTEEPPKLFDIIPYTVLADILAYGAVFLVVVIVLSIISHFLSGWAKAVGLGALDRSFGVVFGIVRAIVLLALLYLPVFMLVEKQQRDEWFKGSRIQTYIEPVSGWIAAMLPEGAADDAKEKTADQADALSKATREKLQDIDILRRENENTDNSAAGAPGYEDEQRENMNDLIDDNFND